MFKKKRKNEGEFAAEKCVWKKMLEAFQTESQIGS